MHKRFLPSGLIQLTWDGPLYIYIYRGVTGYTLQIKLNFFLCQRPKKCVFKIAILSLFFSANPKVFLALFGDFWEIPFPAIYFPFICK